MTLGNAASSDPLKRGLVGWYRFLNNTSDSSGNNTAATAFNSPTTAADKFGNANSAYTFNGSNQYMGLQYPGFTQTTLPVYSDSVPFAVAFWIKGAATTTAFLFHEGSSVSSLPASGIRGGQSSGSKINVFIRNASGVILVNTDSTGTVLDNTWHHTAVNINISAGTGAIYVDGQLDKNLTITTASMGAAMTYSSVAALSRVWATGNYFSGSVSDVRLYRRSLTADQIGTLYRAAQRI